MFSHKNYPQNLRARNQRVITYPKNCQHSPLLKERSSHSLVQSFFLWSCMILILGGALTFEGDFLTHLNTKESWAIHRPDTKYLSSNTLLNWTLPWAEDSLLRIFISRIHLFPCLNYCPMISYLLSHKQLPSLPTLLPSPSVGQSQQQRSPIFTSKLSVGLAASLGMKGWQLHPCSTYL